MGILCWSLCCISNSKNANIACSQLLGNTNGDMFWNWEIPMFHITDIETF